MKPSSPFSPAEEDAIAAEVQEDIDAGVGDKHFQEIFDSVNASQGSAHVDMDPGVRERLERFKLEFGAGLNERLRGHEHRFVCIAVNDDGHGNGFIVKVRDGDLRLFTVEVSFEDGFAAAARFGNSEMGRGMMQTVIERLSEARVKYMRRRDGLH